MRKIFILGSALAVSLAMLLASCQNDKENNNDSNNGNQEYPSTADVLPNAVTDIDGNSYDAVRIGEQVWMAENLRTTRYANGTAIGLGNDFSTTTAYLYYPNDDSSNVATYGYLYNWAAVMHWASSSTANPSGVQGVCPNGWHVPSDAEWTQLTDYMRTQPGYMASGNADHLAKALAATWGWNSSDEPDAPGNDPSANNATGFSALPAGYYSGGYNGFGYGALFWNATEGDGASACNRPLYYDYAGVNRSYDGKDHGLSVRCLRD